MLNSEELTSHLEDRQNSENGSLYYAGLNKSTQFDTKNNVTQPVGILTVASDGWDPALCYRRQLQRTHLWQSCCLSESCRSSLAGKALVQVKAAAYRLD